MADDFNIVADQCISIFHFNVYSWQLYLCVCISQVKVHGQPFVCVEYRKYRKSECFQEA